MNQDLRRKLDRITDVLWAGGVVNPVTYIEQLSYLVFLKLLDEEEANREQLARLGRKAAGNSLFPNGGSKYRWSKWRFKSGTDLRDFLRDQVFPYMASKMNDDPQVAEYFRDAVLEILDPNVLKQVVDELDSIDFRKLGPDVKGDIFEYLLTHLGTSSLNGQFRTPRQIRQFMVQMVDPDLGDTICDPSCGTGGFLIDAVDHILVKYSGNPTELPIYGEEWLEKQGKAIATLKAENPNLQTYRRGAGEKLPSWKKLEASVYGFDVARSMLRIAMMNLVLHGVRRAHLKRANVLSDMGGLSEDDMARRYNVLLANPPFAGVLPEESIRQDLPSNARKSELLFLAVIMESLAPGGRCAVVVPDGVLFGSSRGHVELRQLLVENFNLRAVVSLPSGVFKPYAGVKTSVLVFDRPHGDETHNGRPIWFYDVRGDGYDIDKITEGGRAEAPTLNDIPDLLRQWGTYRASGYKKAPGLQGGTQLGEDDVVPRSWWVDVDSVRNSGYNLTASRYQPQPARKAVARSAVGLVRELSKLESTISTDLSALLAALEEGE
jgi:type I restriction enzyme M protein